MRIDSLVNFFIALMPLLDRNLMPTEQARKLGASTRDRRFAPGNDRIWGEGNWIRCPICPYDSRGFEVYHHKDAHT